MRLLSLWAAVLAATVVPQSVEQLTDRATLVVRATVLEQHAERGDGPGGIYTYSKLRVDEALKGAAPAEVLLRQVGGTVGAQTLELPGDARLEKGEAVLVFLTCRPAVKFCNLVGLAQGKYHLAPDAAGGFAATRDFASTSFVQGPPPSAGPERYADLAAKVRAHAGAGR